MGWHYFYVPKHQCCSRWSLRMDKWFHLILYWAYDYLTMLGFKFIHVSKRGPCNAPCENWAQSIVAVALAIAISHYIELQHITWNGYNVVLCFIYCGYIISFYLIVQLNFRYTYSFRLFHWYWCKWKNPRPRLWIRGVKVTCKSKTLIETLNYSKCKIWNECTRRYHQNIRKYAKAK